MSCRFTVWAMAVVASLGHCAHPLSAASSAEDGRGLLVNIDTAAEASQGDACRQASNRTTDDDDFRRLGISHGTRARSVTLLGYDRTRWRLVDNQLKHIRSAVVPRDIEIELASANVVEIEGYREDCFAVEMGTGEHLAQRADDGTTASHQHSIGRIAESHTYSLREILLADELTSGQDEAASLERNVLHRGEPSISIIGCGCAVERHVLRVHGHPQHRHVILPANHRTDTAVGAIHHR